MGLEGDVAAVEQEVVFDHEKLDAYRVARELVTLISGFLKRNIARADKQRFYEIARGSATETAAQLPGSCSCEPSKC